jgi:hypothetical protein
MTEEFEAPDFGSYPLGDGLGFIFVGHGVNTDEERAFNESGFGFGASDFQIERLTVE